MTGGNFTAGSTKTFVALTVAALLLITAGCGMRSDYPRGRFTGYVVDKTEEEVTAKLGKPDAVENTSANLVKWIYKNKTFDPDNDNKPDKEAILILTRDPATGKVKITDVIFNN